MKKDAPRNINKVFLSGFCKEEFTQETLFELLKSKIEGIKSLILPKKRYLGYGFITLDKKSSMDKILKIGKICIGETWLKIQPYDKSYRGQEKRNSILRRKIFVHSIPYWLDETRFKGIFSKYGEVEEAYICQRGKNKMFRKGGKKIGYVLFKEGEIAAFMIQLKFLDFKGCRLRICEVESKRKKILDFVKENLKLHLCKPSNSDYWEVRGGITRYEYQGLYKLNKQLK